MLYIVKLKEISRSLNTSIVIRRNSFGNRISEDYVIEYTFMRIRQGYSLNRVQAWI